MMQQNLGGKNIEVILERAREEETLARSVEKPPRFRVTKETRVADLDSPVLRVNRRAERRKFSTFNMMLLLFGAATAIVIYIGHIINVNHLAIEADKLAQQYDDLLRTRAKLQAEIDSKSGRERIVSLATRQLGLKPLTGQARWIVVENGEASGGESAQ